MADEEGEKIHEPTPHKMAEAEKKGQFAKTKELGALIILFFGYGGLLIFGPTYGNMVSAFTTRSFQWAAFNSDVTSTDMRQILFTALFFIWDVVSVPLIGLWILVVFFSMIQNRFILPEDSLKFNWEKVEPISNFQEKFMSVQPIVELIKSLLKLVLLGFVVWRVVGNQWAFFPALVWSDPSQMLVYLRNTVGVMFWGVMPVIVSIAVLDYAYQWYESHEKLMMTHEEVKEEQKNTEGNPEIKSKQKARQREILLSAIARNVPKADVVIVNPTHYSVALRYNKAEADAPVVVAKGVDYLAFRIRILAEQHNIPIVENPPLARGLYAQTKEGHQIHPDFYASVAQILAVIMNRRKNRYDSAPL